ncbi:hypothetical protein SELMODRAFT_408350 [Selaginella moellendorffii]|uniref:Uncharacterized protein n=1 Tax=Selaginella moellendorffii TaxID=88036 RepID=D8R806_SELML|nr:hypothetical protein SELMODRAFT_408350 [Selaginella moellendorffii]
MPDCARNMHLDPSQERSRHQKIMDALSIRLTDSRINAEQSFVNFVAAVCVQEDSSSLTDWRPDDMLYWASSGSYHLLKPVLGGDHKANEVDLNTHDAFLVRNIKVEYMENFIESPEEFEIVFREINLPECTRASMERRLDGPTIVRCRNVNFECFRHENTTEKDIAECSRAASDYPGERIAPVTRGQEDLTTNARNEPREQINVFLKARKTISDQRDYWKCYFVIDIRHGGVAV